MSGDESCVFGANAPKSEVLGLISRLVNEPGYPIYVLYVAGHGYMNQTPRAVWGLGPSDGVFRYEERRTIHRQSGPVLGIWANSAAEQRRKIRHYLRRLP